MTAALPERREQRARLQRLDDDPDTLVALCERIAKGVAPVDVAHDYGVGLHRFRKWLMDTAYPERLKEYQFALECHADVVAREIIPIADEDGPFVQRDRLRVEARLKVLPFWDARYREPRAGVNISVGAGGSLIAILAGMDAHGAQPAEPAHLVIDHDERELQESDDYAAPQATGYPPTASSQDEPAGAAPPYAEEELL